MPFRWCVCGSPHSWCWACTSSAPTQAKLLRGLPWGSSESTGIISRYAARRPLVRGAVFSESVYPTGQVQSPGVWPCPSLGQPCVLDRPRGPCGSSLLRMSAQAVGSSLATRVPGGLPGRHTSSGASPGRRLCTAGSWGPCCGRSSRAGSEGAGQLARAVRGRRAEGSGLDSLRAMWAWGQQGAAGGQAGG